VVVALAAATLTAGMPPPAYTGQIWSPYPLPATASVAGNPLGGQSLSAARAAERAAVARNLPARRWRGTRAVPPRLGDRWPAAGAGTAAFSADRVVQRGRIRGVVHVAARGWQQAGPLPVRAEQAGGQVAAVSASVAGRRLTGLLGVRGVVFSLAPQGAGQVRVALSYAGFGGAYGGAWATRLRLVRLPACALTTPRRPACRRWTPVTFVNHWRARTLTALIRTGSQSRTRGRAAAGAIIASGGSVILAGVSGPSGAPALRM